MLPPFYYPQVPDDGLVAYVEALARASTIRALAIYLYHIPQNTKVPWPVEVVVRLRERLGATLVGLKDSAGDLAYARAVVAAVPGFDVFPSSEAALGERRGRRLRRLHLGDREPDRAVRAVGVGRRRARRRARPPSRKAADLRAILSAHPLIAAVKAALARRYADPAWARVCAAAAAARRRARRAAARGVRAARRRALTRGRAR